MEIRVAFLPQLAGDVSRAICIVIDALRATTVVATLFDRGCSRVYAAGSHDSARAFARPHGYLLCGESGGLKVPDFDFGNSPVEFSAMDLSGKTVVLSTTNGTKAIAAVSGAAGVLLGSPVNCAAVAGAAWNRAVEQDLDVVLVCSGTDTEFTLEDATTAGLLVEAIGSHAGAWETPAISDSAIAARRLWQTEPNLLRGWMEGKHANILASKGFGEDIGFCATLDRYGCVPTLVGESAASDSPWPVLLAP
jgi:2-phosphosulfolactate phosphatase